MLLNAYYFRQHMYSLVPRHVREDMQWMADVGTRAVSLALLEQDLYAARWNVEIICREAERAGMAVHAVPSRWAGLIAGAPKVPSRFTVDHPEAVSRDASGGPHVSISGAVASVHHPATLEFFREGLTTLLTQWPIAGVIWDEVKNIHLIDHSDAARRALGESVSDPTAHLNATVDFFGTLNQHIKRTKPEARTTLFLYAHCTGEEVHAFARTKALDDYGCDGRPWAIADGGSTEERAGEKCLLDHAPRFFAEARKHGKGGFLLIENQNMQSGDLDLLDRWLDDTIDLDADHVTYYYPRNVDAPDRRMAIIARHLREHPKLKTRSSTARPHEP